MSNEVYTAPPEWANKAAQDICSRASTYSNYETIRHIIAAHAPAPDAEAEKLAEALEEIRDSITGTTPLKRYVKQIASDAYSAYRVAHPKES